MIDHLFSMDSHSTIFLLDPHYRLQFLQHATRLLGCAYICVWSPFPHHSSDHLSCIGAWLQDEHDGGLSRTLFEEYRGSFCRIASGCVPGWAFKDGLPFLALRDSDLMGSASHQVQGQFYQESGIQTAVFVGCQNGEIELGMTNIPPADLQMNVQQVFSEEFIQQSLLSELLQTPPTDQPVAFDIGRPSSSSSSLHSLSIGSSEDSPLLPKQKQPLSISKAIASEPSPAPHQILMQAYGRNQNLQFPAPASDEEAMARAILAVISSSTTSNSYLSQVNIEGRSSGSTGAFKAYKSSSLRPRAEPVKASGLGAQRMVKSVLAMLRRIYWIRYQPRMEPEVVVRPSGNQLHHMISERKRREKLNESFDALRKLLPPGSKKDKASVLSKTRDYLSTLKDQINELDEKNKKLEMQLSQAVQKQDKKADHDQLASQSSENIQVEVTRESESTSESQRICLRIVSRDEECDLADLILRVLDCLKEIGAFKLISVEANSDTPRFAQADLTLQVTADNYNEASLKEAVKKVLEDATVHHHPERK